MEVMVEIEKTIGEFYLQTSFTAEAGAIFGLLGESGCGKSMTLKCIAGIETPDKGRILLNGRTLFDSERGINLRPQKRKIGYLFQDYALFPNLTVWENIAIVLKDKKQTQQYIEQFYLSGLEKHNPSMLSGGQKQRCALARMMASKPELVLLDEPFSAVDRNLKWNLELQIMEILEEIKKPVIFVSHDRDEIYHFCHKIGILEQGSMREVGEREEIFAHPKTVAAAKIMGCENLFSIPGSRDSYVGIPSEAVRPALPGEEAQIRGWVEKIFCEKDEMIFVIMTEQGRFWYRTSREQKDVKRVGEEIGFWIDRTKIWYLSM